MVDMNYQKVVFRFIYCLKALGLAVLMSILVPIYGFYLKKLNSIITQ